MTITISKKFILLAVALLLVVGGVIGGTVAWLVDSTGPVVNTFTLGNVDIELTETVQGPFKVIPGVDIPKDPKVTVKAGSEDCYVFVKIDNTLPETISYTVASGWTPLTEGSNIYYCVQDATITDVDLQILNENTVQVASTITKENAGDINNKTLTFTAYAIQQATFTTAQEAWNAGGFGNTVTP